MANPCDARLLARFLRNEGDDLRPWSPPPPAYSAALVQSQQRIQARLSGEKLLKVELGLLKRRDWPAERCRLGDGVHSRRLTSSDAFIAFLGMDLRVSDSGTKRGRRCLSKRGCGELRRLLHNAGMSASRTQEWKGFYDHHRARGCA